MPNITNTKCIKSLEELAQTVDYSLMNTLNCDPDAKEDGIDYSPREVFSGHYVPVTPTPLKDPIYIAHSHTFFKELGLCDTLAQEQDFVQMFSGDLSHVPAPLSKKGWATGYALSIYGTEYYEQCPFRTGNGYGDGRALSVYEGILKGKRWEMQLKGGGQTPYCRGADGCAVLRSSVREFLAQEHMYALKIPTSRSLSLYTSKTEKVRRPWFRDGSYSRDPEVMIEEPIAISTRVAPSFLRVGQIDLFARRARKNEYPTALEELEKIVRHLIEREYSEVIEKDLAFEEQLVLLAKEFGERLSTLIVDWIRVGYCQGNFNSDNCPAGGYTLDYGPFGFMDSFDPKYQPWTGGGIHFSFLNQPQAAERNFTTFCNALKPLLSAHKEALLLLESIQDNFIQLTQEKLNKMWASKLGLETYDEDFFKELLMLLLQTSVDYTIFFRELSHLPEDITSLTPSFYGDISHNEVLLNAWKEWLKKWNIRIKTQDREALSKQMKAINPKYTLREWHLVPAYQQAEKGDYTLLKELQEIMTKPYEEQTKKIEEKYYALKPAELFKIAGVSHVSCSS